MDAHMPSANTTEDLDRMANDERVQWLIDYIRNSKDSVELNHLAKLIEARRRVLEVKAEMHKS